MRDDPIRRENFNDEYAYQLARQNSGLPCSECWALQGHFERCSLLNSWEFSQKDVDELDRTARVAGNERKSAQINPVILPDWVPEFSVADAINLKGLGVIID